MNNTLGIVITDGVGYRNFVLSTFLERASKSFEKVTIYSGLPSSSYDENLSYSNVDIIELPYFEETKKVWFFRKLKEISHLYLNRRFYGINKNLVRGYPKKNRPRDIVLKVIYLIASIFRSESFIRWVERRQFNSFSRNKIYLEYLYILNQTTPDVLFFTHQRPAYLAPILAAAQKLRIKTTTFIFSWDNLASKGRMLGTFDGYFTWSDLMKKELLEIYPKTSPETSFVVGTPQFEPYILDKYSISKKEFYKRFDLNPNKKTICFSCASPSIGVNDEIYIRSILEYCQGKEIQILVRTSPSEDGKRFASLKEEFPELKWNFPKWIQTRENHAELWSQRLPTVEDVIDLRSILAFSDVNSNMVSTMSLDFMLFDKPVVNTVFGSGDNGLFDDQKFLSYAHYKYVVDSNALTVAKDHEELHQLLDDAFENPDQRKVERKKLLDLEISVPLHETNQKIIDSLKTF